MAKISMSGPGGVRETTDLLMNWIQSGGLSCELVDSVHRTAGGVEIYMLVFEKFYWRASNRVSLTVLVTGDSRYTSVDAIGSGGGQGPIFKMSWGAEENFANSVADILRARGFN